MDARERAARITAIVRDIPRGCVASYGQVAEIAGIPRGARQVGATLRGLPDGHDVPWHRVVQSAGTLAFVAGSPQYALQCERLLDDGVAVRGGRIDMRRHRWQPDLDELLWKPSASWDGA